MNPPAEADATPAPVVCIIDDDRSVRAALADLLACVDMAAHTFASVDEFLARPVPDAPVCLVLDVRMPGQSGMDFQRHLRQTGLDWPVIFITGHGDIAMCAQAMKDGAIEFLEKPFREQDLLDAIARGLACARTRWRRAALQKALQQRWRDLSAGERAVVHRVVQGQLNKQIAWQLGVSEITVKVRRAQAMRKMRAQSLPELVRLMEKLGVENQESVEISSDMQTR